MCCDADAMGVMQCILTEYDPHSTVMRQRLSRDLFSGVVDSLVEGAPQLVSVEWESVVLVSCMSFHVQ